MLCKYATPPKKKMKVQGQMISEPFTGPLAAPLRVQNEDVIAAKTSRGLLTVATWNVQSRRVAFPVVSSKPE